MKQILLYATMVAGIAIVIAQLVLIKKQNTIIMADLKALQDAVTKEDTVIDSAITLIQGLADQIKNLPVGDQAAIDALAADVSGKADALAAAVTANTLADTGTTDGDTTA